MKSSSLRGKGGALLAATAVIALLAPGCETNTLDNHIAACDDYCAVSAECDGEGGRTCTATCEDMVRVGWDYSRECGDAWESWFACMGALSCTEWAEAQDDECVDGIGPTCHCGDQQLDHWETCS